MTDIDNLITVARGWMRTPYHTQASLKGVGCDCAGFIAGVFLEAGIISEDQFAAIPKDYSSYPNEARLREYLSKICDVVPIADADAGDIVLMRYRAQEQHMAMLTSKQTLIHCLQSNVGVFEQNISPGLRRSISSAWRIKSCN